MLKVRTDKQKQKDFDKAMKAGETILNDENRTNDDIKVDLNKLELKYRLEELRGKLLQETEEFHIWLLTAELGSHRGTKKIQREPTKAENEEQVSEEDRQFHEKIMDEVIAKLKSEGEEVEDEDVFEDFYADLKVKAKELGKEYQPKLRNGINLTIDFLNSVGKDKEDGDVDLALKIAPNTVDASFNVDWNVDPTTVLTTSEESKVLKLEGGKDVISLLQDLKTKKQDDLYVSAIKEIRVMLALPKTSIIINVSNLAFKKKKNVKKWAVQRGGSFLITSETDFANIP